MAKQTSSIFRTSGPFLGTPQQIKDILNRTTTETIEQLKPEGSYSRLPAISAMPTTPERQSDNLKDWLIGKPCASPPPASTISYSTDHQQEQQQLPSKFLNGFSQVHRQSLREFLEVHSPTKKVNTNTQMLHQQLQVQQQQQYQQKMYHRKRISLTENSNSSVDESGINQQQSLSSSIISLRGLGKNPVIIQENSQFLSPVQQQQQSENISQRRISSMLAFNSNSILPASCRISNPNPARILSPFLDSKNRIGQQQQQQPENMASNPNYKPAGQQAAAAGGDSGEGSPQMMSRDLSNSKLLFFTPQRSKVTQKSSLFYDLQSITNPSAPALIQPTQRARIEPISKRFFVNTSDRTKQFLNQSISQQTPTEIVGVQSQPFLPNIHPRQEKKAFSLVEAQSSANPTTTTVENQLTPQHIGRKYIPRNSQSFSQLQLENSQLINMNHSLSSDSSKSQIKSILKPQISHNRRSQSVKKSVGFQEKISIHFLQQQDNNKF